MTKKDEEFVKLYYKQMIQIHTSIPYHELSFENKTYIYNSIGYNSWAIKFHANSILAYIFEPFLSIRISLLFFMCLIGLLLAEILLN